MALPDPVFSHLDHVATIHRYGRFALRAAQVQNFNHYYLNSPELGPALEETYQRLTPSFFTADFHEAFGVDLLKLPEAEARLLLYYALTGQLPPAPIRAVTDAVELTHAHAAIPLALANLQSADGDLAKAGATILTNVIRLLRIASRE